MAGFWIHNTHQHHPVGAYIADYNIAARAATHTLLPHQQDTLLTRTLQWLVMVQVMVLNPNLTKVMMLD